LVVAQSQAPARVQLPASLISIAVTVALVVFVLGVLAEIARRLLTPQAGVPAEYRRVKALLTDAELRFFHVLRDCVPSTQIVLCKVRVADFVTPAISGPKRQTAFNRISAKHADFLLCDAESMSPLLVIELDDKSHERGERRDRDAFMDSVYASVQLPILHVKVQAKYSAADLRARISAALSPVAK
jgi:hypothetical protein